MKQFIAILFFIIPSTIWGQFPELKEQQDRAITFNKVKTLKVYIYDYQNKSVDTTFSTFQSYNEKGNLIERRDYFENDSISYERVVYSYDTLGYDVLKKTYMDTASPFNCYSYQGHPRKKIEEGNEKGQLIITTEYHDEGLLKMTYSYYDNDLLKQVDMLIDTKLTWIYKILYEYY
ncbi:MAG: hypothetical protein COB85_01125 [Bacteroidetes bacterium]|nr:MAG: hypothetical protein COB85_01125 [Bacteroidota bacterium]